MAHPQCQPLVAQEQFIGIEIDRNQRFVGGIAQNIRKMWMIPKYRNVFRSDPNFQFNFFCLAVRCSLEA